MHASKPRRSPLLREQVSAQSTEPPYTDPYVRWCGRGGAARLPPIPIVGTKRTSCDVRVESAFRVRAEVKYRRHQAGNNFRARFQSSCSNSVARRLDKPTAKLGARIS